MKVLLLQNPGPLRAALRALLESWGYAIVPASDGYEAREMLLAEHAPRLAILEAYMPGISGLQLCEMVRAQNKNYTYVILVSSGDQQSSMYRAFECGADHVIHDRFDESELRLRLQVAERILKTHQVLLDDREAFRFEASHDSLLRVWNRKGILNLLTIELSRAKRLQLPLSILLADLDYFKHINDHYGHLIGDEVLRNAAIRMSGEVREYDHLGRYGGEEFLAVLPNCPGAVARQVAERIRRSLAERPLLTDPRQVEATVSIGVSQWRPGQEIPDLLEQADIALYRAKGKGRNRVEFIEAPPCSPEAAERSLQNFRRRNGTEYGPPALVAAAPTSRSARPVALDGAVHSISIHIADGSANVAKADTPLCLKANDKVNFQFQMKDGRAWTLAARVHDCNATGICFEAVSCEPDGEAADKVSEIVVTNVEEHPDRTPSKIVKR